MAGTDPRTGRPLGDHGTHQDAIDYTLESGHHDHGPEDQPSEEVVEAVARAIERADNETGYEYDHLHIECSDWGIHLARAAIAAMPSIPQESDAGVTEELRWHVARALSIPQHHTTWDTLSESEKDLFYMQADYAITAMTSARDREQPK